MARAPVRLLVLLALLGAVAALGVPKIIDEVSASGIPGCSLGRVPQQIQLTPANVERAVRASGLPLLVGSGSLDVEGFQPASATWLDVPPPSAQSNGEPFVGGYEIRWWSPDQDHQGADLFIFRSERDAARYVRKAASTGCRTHAHAYRLAQPAGARALVWVNPLGWIQADVFFSRGDRVYRLFEVAPGGYQATLTGPGARLLIGTSQLLACEVKGAGCARSTG
jgi:hypothetical protein